MSLNLGGITFGLDANTSGLSTAQSKLQEFGNTVASAMKNTKGAIDETTSALIRQEGQAVRGLMQVQDMIAKINSSKIAPEAKVDSIKYLENAYAAYVKALTEPKGSTLNALGNQRVNLGWQENINFINRQVELEKESAAQIAKNNYLWSKQQEEIAKAEARLKDYQDRLGRQQAAGNVNPKQAETLNTGAVNATREYTSGLQSSLLTHEQLTNAQLKLRSSMTAVTRDMRETAAATNPFVQGLSNLSNMATLIGGPFGSFATQLQQSHQLMSENSFSAGLLLTSFAALAAGAVSMASAITHVTIEYEKVIQVQNAVVGSTSAGVAQFQFLVQVANQAGISISALTPVFNRFIASAVGSGTSLHEADQQVKNLAVTFGVMHLSSQDAANALKAFDEIMSRGYVTSRDLVTRLSNDFPGAMTIAKLATGSTGAELDKMLKAGQVNGPAFVKAFQEAAATLFHIDLSKPVDTLQASIERLHNKWDVFVLNISQAMEASQAFKNVLNGLGQAFDFLSSHTTLVIQVIAALVGGLAGLATVLTISTVVSSLASLWLTLTKVFWGAVAVLSALRTSLAAASSAMVALDVAADANPIGALVTAFFALVAVIGGATWAYNQITKSMQAAGAVQADTSGIDAYIIKAKQQKLQIDELTNAYLKNSQAALLNQQAQYDAAVAQLSGAKSTLAELTPKAGFNGTGHNAGIIARQRAEQEQIVAQQEAQVQAMRDGMRNSVQRISDLREVGTFKSDTTLGAGSTKAGPDPKGSGIPGLDALIAKAKGAEAELANMWKGPPNEALMQAFEKTSASIEAIGDDAKKQALAADKLGVSWDNVASRMNYLNVQVVLTSNAVKDFTKIWEDVHKTEGTIKGINDEITALGQNLGKDNPGKSLAEGMKQAQAEMAKLSSGALKDIFNTIDRSGMNPNDNAASKAFAVKAQAEQTSNLVTFLRQQGIAVKDLATDYDTALNALAKFYAGEQKAKETLTNLTNAEQALREMRKQNTASAAINGAQGGLGGIQNAQNQQTAAGLFGQFGLAGAAAGNAYAGALGTQQSMNDALKVTQTILDGQIKSWQQFGTNGVNAFEGVILGTTKLKTALNTVLKDFITTMANTTFFDPLKANLSSAIQQAMTGKGFGGFSLGNLFGGAQNGAAVAAQTANTAQLVILNGFMTTLVAIMQAQALTGNLPDLPLGLTLADGGKVGGAGTGTSDSIMAMLSNGEYVVNASATSKFLPLLEAINGGKIGKHAAGGPIGQVTTADLYASGSGQNGSLQSGSNSHIIDASTTIHVAGNMDSVSMGTLKAHLAQRDQQLRAQLPLLIDSRVQDSLTRNRYQR